MQWPQIRHLWQQPQQLPPKQFTCGYCGRFVVSDKGYVTSSQPPGWLFICPGCSRPTYFCEAQIPGVAPGTEVPNVPPDVSALYNEARNSLAANAPTAAVFACRKLLMNLAVSEGAPPDQTFLQYVEYLAKTGHVPPKGKGWVDHIRSKGNEANHEIALMKTADATELITFAEMLLKFIYDFPNRVPPKPGP